MGVDPGPQLAEMHRAGDGILGAGEQGFRHRVRAAVHNEDEHGRAGVLGSVDELSHQLGQTRVAVRDCAEEEVRRWLAGARGGTPGGAFGDLESAAHQKPLQPFRPSGGITDQENAAVELLRQATLPAVAGVKV